MKTMLHIDIETYSEYDLTKCGAYKYAEKSKLLLFAYAFDSAPVQLIDTANGETLPEVVADALLDPAVVKVAHNANFERTLLTKYTGVVMPPEQWYCTAVHAAYAGLPRGLDNACTALGIKGKPKGSQSLIRKFSVNGDPCEGLDWQMFREYCINDVEIERELHARIKCIPVPQSEWNLWYVDQRINDRGFLVDLDLVNAAITVDEAERERLLAECARLTGCTNPNSAAQLKEWLGDADCLDKAAVASMLKACPDATRRRVLEIRQETAQSASKKYAALRDATCSDGRCRGTLMHYGAHTGRWSGRLFQPQNLPRAHVDDLPFARQLVVEGRADDLALVYGSVGLPIAALIRSAIIAPAGRTLRVDDYAQIEARVCAWLAGEQWIMDTFRKGLPYYEVTASKMYGVPLEAVTKELRQKGKAAALSLQYQGAAGALKRMGSTQTDTEMLAMVKAWRTACPAMCALWYDLNTAAVAAVQGGVYVKVGVLTLTCASGCLLISLPSGRQLVYRDAHIATSPRSGETVVAYMGEYKGKMVLKYLYGGLITENVVQAIARDLLGEYLKQCAGTCVLHVHDEVVLEGGRVAMVPPAWCDGLPLEMDGFDSPYYRKG